MSAQAVFEVGDRTNVKRIKTSIENRGFNVGKVSVGVVDGKYQLRFATRAQIEDIQGAFENEFVDRIWMEAIEASSTDPLEGIIARLPKRFSIYPPMLLLPPSTDDSVFANMTPEVFESLLAYFSKHHAPNRVVLSHLAINRPIPIEKQTSVSVIDDNYNSIRSPSQITMLYGDFEGLWVSTTQNGIFQTWMPYHTMFSRGNIKEKARILDAAVMSDSRHKPYAHGIAGGTIMDLYVGIGYFTLSYLDRGARRVVCWDINPKSIQGLIRGVKGNGYGECYHVKQEDSFDWKRATEPAVRCIVFEESNERAMCRMLELVDQVGLDAVQAEFGISHFNLGMLPTSRAVWGLTCELASLFGAKQNPIWVHVHDNVATAALNSWKMNAENYIRGKTGALVTMDWVEHVKTYAPDVWHLVGDVRVDFSSGKK